MKKAAFILISILFVYAPIFGQMNKDLFPLGREYRKTGFYINPELTYLLSFGKSEHSYNLDTLDYNYQVKGSGKLKYGLELGYFYSFKNPKYVHFLEGGIGYRAFAGKATHSGIINTPSDTINYSSDNTINTQYIQASVRASHVKQLKRYSFIVNSIGVNTNYAISEKYQKSGSYPNSFDTFTQSFNTFITYQIGFGYRITKHTILIPSIETTLLQVMPFHSPRENFDFFNHEYQPLVFKLRIMFLRKDPVNCNAPRFDGPQPAL